jgi:phosphoribosylformimino-5-aminoimidazole carboxamide ribotide isomerase
VILYPAIDIRAGRAVRLVQGDFERETAYDADPVDAARRWAEGGAEWLHVVDLDGAREGRSVNLEHVRRIAAAVEAPIQLGGGLRDRDAIADALAAGVDRVVLGTAALRDPGLLDAALAEHGDSIVVSVDARHGRVALAGWTEETDVEASVAVAEMADRGVARLVFTPVEVDGTLAGPGIEELGRVGSRLKEAGRDMRLIYSGGVGELEDLRALTSEAPGSVEGVIVGRALYEGRFTLAEARAALEG